MLPKHILVALLALALNSAHAQKVENADFAKGKASWLGDGKVVFMDPQGEVSDEQKPGTTQVIRIELNSSRWTGLRQKLRPKSSDTQIEISFQVKAGKDFKRAAESRSYTSDFKEGGQYGWSAEVYPKCDLLVRVKDEGWQYRPLSLMPVDSWKTVSQSISGLKARQRELEILFPPGEGVVYLKGK